MCFFGVLKEVEIKKKMMTKKKEWKKRRRGRSLNGVGDSLVDELVGGASGDLDTDTVGVELHADTDKDLDVAHKDTREVEDMTGLLGDLRAITGRHAQVVDDLSHSILEALDRREVVGLNGLCVLRRSVPGLLEVGDSHLGHVVARCDLKVLQLVLILV